MTRCILCYRCVYTADQLTPQRVHGVLGRGDASEIGTYIENSLDNEFSGNVIDVCPVGALTDKTFRFKQRVWFTKPVDAHRACPTKDCAGRVTLWYRGDDVLRVTGRKDAYNEVHEFICNECRFEKKQTSDWTIEGPRQIARQSVIAQNHPELGRDWQEPTIIPNLPESTSSEYNKHADVSSTQRVQHTTAPQPPMAAD